MVNIYFAGSMQAGGDDTPLYVRIVEHLRSYGTVLSEWVAYRTYDDISDKEAHKIAVENLAEADVLVAEVTIPSLGVGYEIGRMAATKRPILCLFRPDSGRKISAMIQGADNGTSFRVIHYKEENFAEVLDTYFASFRKSP